LDLDEVALVTDAGAARQAFFEQQGTVRSVRMRRHLRSGDFKGSVFVEFDSEGLAKEVRCPGTSQLVQITWRLIIDITFISYRVYRLC